MSSDLSPEARALLDAARDTDDPSRVDRTRMRARLTAQLGAAAMGGAAASAAAGASASVAPHAAGTVAAGTSSSAVAGGATATSLAKAGAAVAGLSAAAGTGAGAGAGGSAAAALASAKLWIAVSATAALAVGGGHMMATHGAEDAKPPVEVVAGPAESSASAPPQGPLRDDDQAAAVSPAQAILEDVPTAVGPTAPPATAPTQDTGSSSLEKNAPATATAESNAPPAAAAIASLAQPKAGEGEKTSARPRRKAQRATAKPAPRPRAAAQAVTQQGAGAEPPRATEARKALGEELRLLRQAQAALGQRSYARAERFAVEHARRFPDGSLTPERLGVLALVDCARGGHGGAAARQLLRSYPDSPVSQRVRRACGGD